VCSSDLPDEFQATLEGLTGRAYMAGARGMMLTLYDGDAFTKARTKKRGKGGEKQNDSVVITNPHLSIVGACTPAIYDKLSSADVEDGLLPRFAIVLPETAPPFMGLDFIHPTFDAEREALIQEFKRIRGWAETVGINARVEWPADALAALNDYLPGLELRSGAGGARLPAMTVKVAMLTALGRGRPEGDGPLVVSVDDVRIAGVMADRWLTGAQRFGAQIGGQTVEVRRHNQNVERAITALQRLGGSASGRDVRRACRNLRPREWDDVARDVQDLGLASIDTKQTGGRPVTTWRLL